LKIKRKKIVFYFETSPVETLVNRLPSPFDAPSETSWLKVTKMEKFFLIVLCFTRIYAVLFSNPLEILKLFLAEHDIAEEIQKIDFHDVHGNVEM